MTDAPPVATPIVDTPLVDAHAHIFQKVMPLVKRPRHNLDYDFTAEQYLAVLDAHGVHFGVHGAASLYGDYNDYTLDSLARHKRLRATVILRPEVERNVLREMDAAGVLGIRLMFMGVPDAELPDLTTFDYKRLFRRLADLGWHVHLHCEAARSAPYIELLEQAGPRLVLDHMAMPDPAQGTASPGFQQALRSVQKGRTWIKLSAGYRMGREAADRYAATLIREAGPERLMWASDCPFASFEDKVTYQDTIDDFLRWVPPGLRRQIGTETALKFYFS